MLIFPMYVSIQYSFLAHFSLIIFITLTEITKGEPMASKEFFQMLLDSEILYVHVAQAHFK